jgi:hypothetical protein
MKIENLQIIEWKIQLIQIKVNPYIIKMKILNLIMEIKIQIINNKPMSGKFLN